MSKLINIEELRKAYVTLYVEIRKYIWPFDTVAHLVDVEMQCYSAFPDIVQLRSSFANLRSDVEHEIDLKDDKELSDAINDFQEIIDSDDSFYNLLSAVREVLSYEDIQEREVQ